MADPVWLCPPFPLERFQLKFGFVSAKSSHPLRNRNIHLATFLLPKTKEYLTKVFLFPLKICSSNVVTSLPRDVPFLLSIKPSLQSFSHSLDLPSCVPGTLLSFHLRESDHHPTHEEEEPTTGCQKRSNLHLKQNFL